MKELKIPDRIKKNIRDFADSLKNIYQQDLVSVILYGSAASGEFVDKHSNLNILVVLKNTDLENLKLSQGMIRKFPMINPLFLTEGYIKTSTDVFPIEFLDMQENYFLLWGKDVLRDITVETSNLRFQCEQELKARLVNLRRLYLRLNKNNLALRNLLFKSLTSTLHILRNILRLEGGKPPYLKTDILKEVFLKFHIDTSLLQKLLALKNKQIKLNNKDIDDLFANFVRELEKIVDMVDRL